MIKAPKFSGMWLIYWREKRHMTQSDLAEMMGLKYQQIQRWEKLENVPSADSVSMLAQALEIDMKELFDH